jgi:hypothetical protein
MSVHHGCEAREWPPAPFGRVFCSQACRDVYAREIDVARERYDYREQWIAIDGITSAAGAAAILRRLDGNRGIAWLYPQRCALHVAYLDIHSEGDVIRAILDCGYRVRDIMDEEPFASRLRLSSPM